MHEPQPTPPYDRQKVEAHVNANLLDGKRNPAIWGKRRCGDDRDEQLNAGEAVFGADIGFSAITLATLKDYGAVTSQADWRMQAIATTHSAISQERVYYVHTGKHGQPGVIAGDCGHFKCIQGDETYGLDQVDIQAIRDYMAEMKAAGRLNEVSYEAEHAAGAVVRDFSNRYAIRSRDPNQQTQVFVLQIKRIMINVKKTAVRLGQEFQIDPDELYQKLLTKFNHHTELTRQKLANDLPIFDAIDGDQEGKLVIEDVNPDRPME